MLRKFAAIAAVGAMIAGPAFAADGSVAQLGAVKGSVMVSQNGKMVAASTASLKAGDRVVASANGSGSVKFADGCVVAVKPASMITVAAKSPCASGAGVVSASSQPQEFLGLSPAATAVVSFVVVGGIVVAATDSNDNSPTSP
jgi:hypothetical protein